MTVQDKRLHVCAFLASPVDRTPAVRSASEMRALADTIRDAGVGVALQALWPPDVAALALVEPKQILHFSCHGSDDGLELQEPSGRSVIYRGHDLVGTLGTGWDLVVLNGCDTQLTGEIINAALNLSVVCTSGYVPDEACMRFTQSFYRSLAEGTPLEEAVDRVAQIVSRLWPQSTYIYMPGRANSFTVGAGATEVYPSFNAATQAAASGLQLSPSRRAMLIKIHQALTGPSRAVAVTGPSRSGVSSLVRAATDYFSWLGSGACLAVDGKAIDPELAIFEVALKDPRSLVIVDHFEDLNDDCRRLLVQAACLPSRERAALVLGLQVALGVGDIPHVPLQELDISEARALLYEGLGSAASEWYWLADTVKRWPGKLQEMLAYVHSGTNKKELEKLLVDGDPSAGVRTIIDRLWRQPDLRVALCCVARYPGVPRPHLKRAWAQALHLAPDAVDAGFAEAMRSLADRGLVQILTSPGDRAVTHVVCQPDVGIVVRHKRTGLTPGQATVMRESMVLGLRETIADGELSGEYDWEWLVGLMVDCRSSRSYERDVLDMLFPHLDRGGEMRRMVDTAKLRRIVDAAFEVARDLDAGDQAAQLALMQGEMRYRAGELKEAERHYRKVLRLSDSPSRRLQAHRALGQVCYRRSEYAQALDCYTRAEAFIAEADPFFVTTLMQERAKALSRLGRGPDAIALLREVLRRRESEGGDREIFRAQHELARALLRVRELPEARSLFQLAYEGALSVRDYKWALGPLYHLLLLDIETDDLEAAQVKLDELSTMAIDQRESLWVTFSKLAGAMLLFSLGRYQAAHDRFRDALSQAEARGYTQVVEDARDWVRRRSQRVINTLGAAGPADDFVEVISLLEGVPVGKARKALRYSSRPDLVRSVRVELSSDHEMRHLQWRPTAGWECTCPLFRKSGKCSHVVAVLLRGISPLTYS